MLAIEDLNEYDRVLKENGGEDQVELNLDPKPDRLQCPTPSTCMSFLHFSRLAYSSIRYPLSNFTFR